MSEKNQIDLDGLIDNLKIFEKMYEIIRGVDPVKKKVLIYRENNLNNLEAPCYDFWAESKICENCISMRAYKEDDTFVKMEYTPNRVYMVTAVPVKLDDRKVVIELLKDVTNSMIIGDGDYGNNIEIHSVLKNINLMSVKDGLTNAFNRRYINERLPVDMVNSAVDNQPLSIIMTDLDHFKNVNDTYGHVAGDFILKEFTKKLEDCIRKEEDWVARYGGEEFLVSLKNTDIQAAHEIAERMRKAVECHTFQYENHRIPVTASFGICTMNNREITVESFIDCADKNLYEAKRTGRNKVVS